MDHRLTLGGEDVGFRVQGLGFRAYGVGLLQIVDFRFVGSLLQSLGCSGGLGLELERGRRGRV